MHTLTVPFLLSCCQIREPGCQLEQGIAQLQGLRPPPVPGWLLSTQAKFSLVKRCSRSVIGCNLRTNTKSVM